MYVGTLGIVDKPRSSLEQAWAGVHSRTFWLTGLQIGQAFEVLETMSGLVDE